MNQLQNWRAVFKSTLPLHERIVLLALIDHLPNCMPSVSRLEQWTQLSRRAVFRALSALEGLGLIEVRKSSGAQNSYRLDLTKLPGMTGATQALVPDSHRCPADTELVPLRHPTSVPQTPKATEGSNRKKLPPKPPKGDMMSKTETDARIQPVVEFYASTFEREFHRKPATNYPRAAKAIKVTPGHVTADELKRAIEVQLTKRRHDQYAGKDAQHVELHEIVGLMNRILAWAPRKVQGVPSHTDEPVVTNRYRRAGK